MTLGIKPILFIVVWFAGAGALLWLGTTDLMENHKLCGLWGCFPSLSAVISLHGLWIWAFLPLTIWLIRRTSGRRMLVVGVSLLMIALGGIAILLSRDFLATTTGTPLIEQYPIRRALFLIATLTDVPLVPSALCGLVLILTSVRRKAPSV